MTRKEEYSSYGSGRKETICGATRYSSISGGQRQIPKGNGRWKKILLQTELCTEIQEGVNHDPSTSATYKVIDVFAEA